MHPKLTRAKTVQDPVSVNYTSQQEMTHTENKNYSIVQDSKHH